MMPKSTRKLYWIISVIFLSLIYFGIAQNRIQVDPVPSEKLRDSSCVLIPVHQPHFGYLRFRLFSSLALNTGIYPNHYIVFDDQLALQNFCKGFEDLCNHKNHHLLDLESLIGVEEYQFVNEYLFRPDAPEFFSDGSCIRSPNRIMQALKKFKGVESIESECESVWVSDSESFPFRPFPFTELLSISKGFSIVASWYKDKWGCKDKINWHNDNFCGNITATRLHLDQSWDFQVNQYDFQKGEQMIWQINDWWFYNPQIISRTIKRAEILTKTTFSKFWMTMRDSCSSFYHHHAEYFAAVEPSLGVIKNFPEEISNFFPGAFDQCCHCQKSGKGPCMKLNELWKNPCFVESGLDWSLIGKFIVERLGVFGLYHRYFNTIPIDLLESEHRLSWCIHNCNFTKFRSKLESFLDRPTLAVIDNAYELSGLS
jgi:hypothetical protein